MTSLRIFCWVPDPSDFSTIELIEAEAFAEASWGAAGVRSALLDERNCTLVAGCLEGRIDGFSIWRSLGDEAELLTIGVEPSCRRCGVAGAILSEIEKASESEGCQAIFLEVNGDNAAAIALYERHDFQAVGARARYYRNGGDAIIMRKDLSPRR